MTITKRPATASAAAIDEFIARAPDAEHGKAHETVKRRKVMISLGVDPVLLAGIDSSADRLGLSRAAAISLAISQFVNTPVA